MVSFFSCLSYFYLRTSMNIGIKNDCWKSYSRHLTFPVISIFPNIFILSTQFFFKLTIRSSNLILKHQINVIPSLLLMKKPLDSETLLKSIFYNPFYHFNRRVLSVKHVGRIFILFLQIGKLMHRD